MQHLHQYGEEHEEAADEHSSILLYPVLVFGSHERAVLQTFYKHEVDDGSSCDTAEDTDAKLHLIDVVENEEGPALGGAMLAAVGCGEYPDVETAAEKIVKVVDTVEPDEELTAKYEERYQQFRKIYPTVKCLYDK